MLKKTLTHLKPRNYVLNITLESFYKTNLLKIEEKLKKITDANRLTITTTKISYTLLKSPHVNKKSREQYKITANRQTIKITSPNPKSYLKFIENVRKTQNDTKMIVHSVD